MLKYCTYDVVFQEIPDEVSLAISLTNCPNHCPGCHSPQLWRDEGHVLDREALKEILARYKGYVTCCCLMGGDNDPDAVVETAVQNGYTNLYKQQLKTLTEFEKMMGKKRFHELLGDYVAKAPGKLALVPDSDPRPAVEPTVTAGMEFDEILE